MNGEKWTPTLPSCARCIICGGLITGMSFMASKPRRGPILYAHTQCFEEEQKEGEKA